jgi:uncharacterized protein YciI
MTDIRFVVLHHRGPAWIPWKTKVEQPGTAAHVAHWAAWFEAGKLAWGGPHTDATGGGMMIPGAGITEDEVRAYAYADPAVRAGVLVAEIRPWLVAMRADG